MYLQDGRGIYEYEVRFHPSEDDRIICEKLLFAQHRELFGRHRRTFDGVTLYLPHKLPDEVSANGIPFSQSESHLQLEVKE